MMRHRNEHFDPSSSPVLRLFRRYVPMTDDYQGQRFFVRRRTARWWPPRCCGAGAGRGHRHRLRRRLDPGHLRRHPGDVPGLHRQRVRHPGPARHVLPARRPDRTASSTSRLGLALVLVWVGIKMLLQVDLYKMPTWLSLGVVATIITVAIVASLRATRGQAPVPHTDPEQLSSPPAEGDRQRDGGRRPDRDGTSGPPHRRQREGAGPWVSRRLQPPPAPGRC